MYMFYLQINLESIVHVPGYVGICLRNVQENGILVWIFSYLIACEVFPYGK